MTFSRSDTAGMVEYHPTQPLYATVMWDVLIWVASYFTRKPNFDDLKKEVASLRQARGIGPESPLPAVFVVTHCDRPERNVSRAEWIKFAKEQGTF